MEKIELKHGVINGKKQYYVDFYHDRKRIRLVLGKNKERAEKVRAKWDLEVYEGRFNFNVKKECLIRFKEAASEYLEKYSKPNKGSWKRDAASIKCLNSFFADCYVNDINTLKYGEYITKRKADGVSYRTIDIETCCIKHIFSKLVEWGKLSVSPMINQKLFRKDNKRIKYLTVEQVQKLYSSCSKHLLPIVKTAINTGCRKSEILRLCWKEVDINANLIYIRNTKSGKNRQVPFGDELRETFLELRKNPRNSKFVFCDSKGKPFKEIRKSFQTALKKAGITEFTFHDLRHHYACVMASKGLDIVSLKEFLGHQSVEMTMRYASFMPDKTKKAIEILNAQSVIIWSFPKKTKGK